jgi:hypothetical protein
MLYFLIVFEGNGDLLLKEESRHSGVRRIGGIILRILDLRWLVMKLKYLVNLENFLNFLKNKGFNLY